jgi:flavin reductase (DIM6/NTAB) family NADH-FMN oxidoreductase RutF
LISVDVEVAHHIARRLHDLGAATPVWIRGSRKCVIDLPTTALTDTVVGIGNTSGAAIDKFADFGQTAASLRDGLALSVRSRYDRWMIGTVFLAA